MCVFYKMSSKYTDTDYQYYTQSSLLSLPLKSIESLAKKLLEFNINKLSTDDKINFHQNLSVFQMPTKSRKTTGFLTRDDQNKYYINFAEVGNRYNQAIKNKIKEIEASGLPDVPDIELDLNDEKTIPLGINTVSTEDIIDKPTMGGKQRKVLCGCGKRGGRPRGTKSRSKSRSKSRTRSKSKNKK